MKPNTLISIAALFALIAIIIGAFAAHLLKEILTDTQIVSLNTAVRYQMWHSLVLLFLALVKFKAFSKLIQIAEYFFIVGILLFSGSIYVLVFMGLKWFGPITPLGGICLMIAWSLIIFSAKNLNYET